MNGPQEVSGAGQPEQSAGSMPAALILGRSGGGYSGPVYGQRHFIYGSLAEKRMSKREWFTVYPFLAIAVFLTVATPFAVSRLISTSQLEAAKQVTGWGITGVFGALSLFAVRLSRYYVRILCKSVDTSLELFEGYKESAAQTDQIIKIAKEAQDLLDNLSTAEEKILTPALGFIEGLLKKITDTDNLNTGALPAIAGLPPEHDYAARMAALQSDLEAMIDFRFGMIPRRGPGRPGKVIAIPTAGGQAISKPIKDPAVMAYLVRLQEAKERGELAQACKENPWGGPAIPESTARDWLRRYQAELSAARNSGNNSL